MESVIVAYCNTNERDFEQTIPLNFVGRRNQDLGLSNDIHILFAYGYDRLSTPYKNSLKQLGFKVHDVFPLYQEIERRYPVLHEKFSNYAKNTFLQWLVMDAFFAGNNIIHYDGDIVFNEDPKVIAQKVTGKTFVLQGCPAFTAVSNKAWFEVFKHHIDEFLSDMEGYSQRAWAERNGWEVTFKTRWAGSRFSVVPLHDQDLLSHLIHTGRIYQDSVEDISLCLQDYVAFENPLFIHLYDDNFPYTYSRERGIDYFSSIRRDGEDCAYKKKVLFWHMQNCFNFYASKFVLRKKLLPWLPLGRVNLDLCGQGFEDKINKQARRLLHHTNRLTVYNYFFKDADFSGLLHDKRWWKKGIFN